MSVVTELVHAERSCRPDVALCGAPLAETDYIDEGDDSPECPECVAIEQATAVSHGEACAVCWDASWLAAIGVAR